MEVIEIDDKIEENEENEQKQCQLCGTDCFVYESCLCKENHIICGKCSAYYYTPCAPVEYYCPLCFDKCEQCGDEPIPCADQNRICSACQESNVLDSAALEYASEKRGEKRSRDEQKEEEEEEGEEVEIVRCSWCDKKGDSGTFMFCPLCDYSISNLDSSQFICGTCDSGFCRDCLVHYCSACGKNGSQKKCKKCN